MSRSGRSSHHSALGLDATGEWPLLRADAKGTKTQQRKHLMEYLDRYLNHCKRTRRKGAMIFDIDDTLIDARDNLIPEVVHIFNKFNTVFPTYILTARPSRGRASTERMLRNFNLKYDKLIMLPPSEEDDPGLYKWKRRCRIAKMHDRVLVACGDQAWDALPWPAPVTLKYLVRNPHNGALVRNKNEIGVLLPSTR